MMEEQIKKRKTHYLAGGYPKAQHFSQGGIESISVSSWGKKTKASPLRGNSTLLTFWLFGLPYIGLNTEEEDGAVPLTGSCKPYNSLPLSYILYNFPKGVPLTSRGRIVVNWVLNTKALSLAMGSYGRFKFSNLSLQLELICARHL